MKSSASSACLRCIHSERDISGDGLNRERYLALQKDLSLKLTAEELAAGWFFCNCEWDGMLCHKNMAEAEFCHCFNPSPNTASNRGD